MQAVAEEEHLQALNAVCIALRAERIKHAKDLQEAAAQSQVHLPSTSAATNVLRSNCMWYVAHVHLHCSCRRQVLQPNRCLHPGCLLHYSQCFGPAVNSAC